ncbi:MAG: hypothetical protein MRY83_03735 [Flavobacteriales bacterium]|nr:hypothetical protein [Flavobacteriales bacterium]
MKHYGLFFLAVLVLTFSCKKSSTRFDTTEIYFESCSEDLLYPVGYPYVDPYKYEISVHQGNLLESAHYFVNIARDSSNYDLKGINFREGSLFLFPRDAQDLSYFMDYCYNIELFLRGTGIDMKIGELEFSPNNENLMYPFNGTDLINTALDYPDAHLVLRLSYYEPIEEIRYFDYALTFEAEYSFESRK